MTDYERGYSIGKANMIQTNPDGTVKEGADKKKLHKKAKAFLSHPNADFRDGYICAINDALEEEAA